MFIIVVYLAIMAFVYYKEFGIAYHHELGNYLSGIFAPISAFGTIVVTYYIYKLTSKERRADEDFRSIVGLYYKIQESFELLKKQTLFSSSDKNHNSYYERLIKVDCLLLLNYIRRYPNKKYNTENIEKAILGVYVNPNYESDYIELANEIQNFCYELNPDLNPSVFKLN